MLHVRPIQYSKTAAKQLYRHVMIWSCEGRKPGCRERLDFFNGCKDSLLTMDVACTTRMPSRFLKDLPFMQQAHHSSALNEAEVPSYY